jgi:hypothetical protein
MLKETFLIRKIDFFRTLPIKKKYQDLADNFDYAFWCGDLNFRLEQTREVVIREVKDGTSILDFDQVSVSFRFMVSVSVTMSFSFD